MKKVLISLLCLILSAAFLTGCASSAVTPEFSENWGKTDVYEKSVYTVVSKLYDAEDKDGNKLEKTYDSPDLFGEGTYTSIIEGSSSTEFTVTTEFVFDGYYEYADQRAFENGATRYDVHDKITATATFQGLSNLFYPVRSEKHYEVTSPVFNYNDNTTSLLEVNCTVSVTYGTRDERTASVKVDFSDMDLPTDSEVYTQYEDYERVYSKLKGTMFDNEYLFYALRSVKKANASLSFNVLSPLLNTVEKATFMLNTNTGVDGIMTKTFHINGKEEELEVYSTMLILGGGYRGPQINLFFAKDDLGSVHDNSGKSTSMDRSRLLGFEQQAGYQVGTLVYTLTEYTYGK